MNLRCVLVLLQLAACAALQHCPASGETLDLDQFAGDWYVIAGTPVTGRSLSKCGHFAVKKTSPATFAMRYTAVSHRHNSAVAFNVHGRVVDGDITGNWQLEGSKRILGPFKHVVISVDYSSHLVLLSCSEDSHLLAKRKFAMIWSRRRSLSDAILDELKEKLQDYFKRSDILTMDQTDC